MYREINRTNTDRQLEAICLVLDGLLERVAALEVALGVILSNLEGE